MKKRKKQQVAVTILRVIGSAGLISVALIAPNSLKILDIFGAGRKKYANKKYYLKTVIRRLERKGFIKLVENRGKKYFELTDKGRVELVKKQKLGVRKPKKWDKKWRVVIFDIKETKRTRRDQLRDCLKAIGFKKIQHSVWVYPYKCDDLIFLLKTDYSLGKEVLYLEVDRLENDGWLRNSFKITS